MMFDRETFFSSVRKTLFSGSLTQAQVDGMETILASWESYYATQDLRWLAYAFATTIHETSKEMQPIAEYGKGAGQPYGEIDPETGVAYFGRGFVQLTWRDNYARADRELELTGDMRCEYDPDLQLDARLAAPTMFRGMMEGWFRTKNGKPETLSNYFNDSVNDPYGARNIINGDTTKVPSWSHGVSIGNLIADYHYNFLEALTLAADAYVEPRPEPGPDEDVKTVRIDVNIGPVPEGVRVEIYVNGTQV